MKFNIAPLMPQILAALRPGANAGDLIKAIGVEIKQIDVRTLEGTRAVAATAEALASAEMVIFADGKPDFLNGKRIRVLAVLGDFPEPVKPEEYPASLST